MWSDTHILGVWQNGLKTKPLPAKALPRLTALQERYQVERKDWEDLFVDPHQWSGQGMEHGVGISPCLRPTNAVWSARLKRFLTGAEHLRLQGLFPADFHNPQPRIGVLRKVALAWHSAPQHCRCTFCAYWFIPKRGTPFVRASTNARPTRLTPLRHVDQQSPTPANVLAPSPVPAARTRTKARKSTVQAPRPTPGTTASSAPFRTPTVSGSSKSKGSASNPASSSGNSELQFDDTPACNRRKKHSRHRAVPAKKRGHNKKGLVPTLASKVAALREWDRLKLAGEKFPEKLLLTRKAEFPCIFKGCFAKWRKVATKERWYHIVDTVSGVSHKKKQVPFAKSMLAPALPRALLRVGMRRGQSGERAAVSR